MELLSIRRSMVGYPSLGLLRLYRDKKFLSETAYDIIKGSANFATDYLWHRKDGVYTAAPSTSPEHGPIDEGATFAHAVIREILLDAVEASKILGKDAKDRKLWKMP